MILLAILAAASWSSFECLAPRRIFASALGSYLDINLVPAIFTYRAFRLSSNVSSTFSLKLLLLSSCYNSDTCSIGVMNILLEIGSATGDLLPLLLLGFDLFFLHL